MIRDISVPLHPAMPTFPGDPAFKRWLACDMSKGGAANTSHVDFGAHCGTHVDAPLHMIAGGPDVTAFSLDCLLGEAVVVEISDRESIRLAEIQGAGIPKGGRVLFKTANSSLWKRGGFEKDFVHEQLLVELESRFAFAIERKVPAESYHARCLSGRSQGGNFSRNLYLDGTGDGRKGRLPAAVFFSESRPFVGRTDPCPIAWPAFSSLDL